MGRPDRKPVQFCRTHSREAGPGRAIPWFLRQAVQPTLLDNVGAWYDLNVILRSSRADGVKGQRSVKCSGRDGWRGGKIKLGRARAPQLAYPEGCAPAQSVFEAMIGST
jgi:hypothetical protein